MPLLTFFDLLKTQDGKLSCNDPPTEYTSNHNIAPCGISCRILSGETVVTVVGCNDACT